MKYVDAKKLHNQDEVILKTSNEVVKVISVETEEKDVWIYTTTKKNGYTKMHHKEIK